MTPSISQHLRSIQRASIAKPQRSSRWSTNFGQNLEQLEVDAFLAEEDLWIGLERLIKELRKKLSEADPAFFMRRPRQRGGSYRRPNHFWVGNGDLRYYRAPPGEEEISRWLKSIFRQRSRHSRSRTRLCRDHLPEATIQEGYKEALDLIEGWHKRAADREGKWVFTGLIYTAGKSGLSMLRVFREANGLTAHSYYRSSRHTTEIPKSAYC